MTRADDRGNPGRAADAIDSYQPMRKTVKDPALTAEVLAFCRPLAAAAHPATADEAGDLMGALFPHAQWARMAGMPLKAEVVLHPQNVRKWIAGENHDRARGWKRHAFHSLQKAALAARVDGWAKHRIVLPREGPARPYDASEELSYRQQSAQKHRLNRHEWMLIAAGSLGLGLAGPELKLVCRADFKDMGDGRVAVHVGGRNPRLVPCRKLWTPIASEAAEAADNDQEPLIGADGRNHVYHIAGKFASRDGKGLSLPRARATWLAAHLAEETPLPALCKIAGPVSADTLKALMAVLAAGLDDRTAARQGLRP